MGRSYKKIINRLLIAVALMACLNSLDSFAKVTKINDKGKTMQVKSMEGLHWEFHPGLYYILFHNDGYAGGSMNWIGHITWKERKSKVGWVGKWRVAETGFEETANLHAQAELDSISPLVEEERLRAAERQTDLVYLNYSDELHDNFDKIDEILIEISNQGQTNLAIALSKLHEDKNMLKEEMKYIHESVIDGVVDNEMEETKRTLAYEELLKKQKDLINKSAQLYRYALAHNKIPK
ncbi:MAG: DUF5045 domain-containing protein [Muribaculum sp.]|nr:DUF5045 domain-containing protein [Muribaculum sp.]